MRRAVLPFSSHTFYSMALALALGCAPTDDAENDAENDAEDDAENDATTEDGGGDEGIPSADQPGSADEGERKPDATADACATTDAETCAALAAKIAKLQTQSEDATQRGDWAASARHSLDANEQRELLALYAKHAATGTALDAVGAKYVALRARLEEHLAIAEPGQPDGQTLVYHPLEVDAVAKVRESFGDLYIGATPDQADGAAGFEELSVPMPWAGYWYPMRDSSLFATEDAPLAKLDRAVEALGGFGRSVAIERDEHDAAAADTWEGLCGAWALAAVSTPEPMASVTVGGESFSTNDQKALLTKLHERAPSLYFGIRYNGDAATDGTLQDLRPEAFHRIFTEMLGERRRAFLVDSDPSIEVWSKPVYRVRWKVTKDPEVADAFLVQAFPWMVRHRETLDEAPTSASDRASPKYEYRLYVDATARQGDRFKVIAGEWLGTSRDSHPDALMILKPGAEGEKASLNDGINDAMDIVRQIVTLESP